MTSKNLTVVVTEGEADDKLESFIRNEGMIKTWETTHKGLDNWDSPANAVKITFYDGANIDYFKRKINNLNDELKNRVSTIEVIAQSKLSLISDLKKVKN